MDGVDHRLKNVEIIAMCDIRNTLCGTQGAAAFLGARLQSGIDVVLETIHFDKMLEDCSLVITGEGKIDGQSIQGKVVSGVARRAAKKNVPVLVVVGAIQDRTKSDLRKTVQFSDLQRGQNK